MDLKRPIRNLFVEILILGTEKMYNTIEYLQFKKNKCNEH